MHCSPIIAVPSQHGDVMNSILAWLISALIDLPAVPRPCVLHKLASLRLVNKSWKLWIDSVASATGCGSIGRAIWASYRRRGPVCDRAVVPGRLQSATVTDQTQDEDGVTWFDVFNPYTRIHTELGVKLACDAGRLPPQTPTHHWRFEACFAGEFVSAAYYHSSRCALPMGPDSFLVIRDGNVYAMAKGEQLGVWIVGGGWIERARLVRPGLAVVQYRDSADRAARVVLITADAGRPDRDGSRIRARQCYGLSELPDYVSVDGTFAIRRDWSPSAARRKKQNVDMICLVDSGDDVVALVDPHTHVDTHVRKMVQCGPELHTIDTMGLCTVWTYAPGGNTKGEGPMSKLTRQAAFRLGDSNMLQLQDVFTLFAPFRFVQGGEGVVIATELGIRQSGRGTGAITLHRIHDGVATPLLRFRTPPGTIGLSAVGATAEIEQTHTTSGDIVVASDTAAVKLSVY